MILAATVTAPRVLAQDSPSRNSQEVRETTDVADGLTIGHPVHTIDPVIPTSLRDQFVAAVLSATMTKAGTFQNLVFTGGSSEVGNPAITAVSQWLYTPSTKAGEPVDVNVYVILDADHGHVSSSIEPNLPFPTKPAPLRPDLEGKVFTTIRDMQPPRAIYSPDPEYSRAARAARWEGTVVLGVLIGSNGTVIDVWVKKSVGFGLDQKALDAVRRWKFQPAIKDGKPVAIEAMIEVAFHLS